MDRLDPLFRASAVVFNERSNYVSVVSLKVTEKPDALKILRAQWLLQTDSIKLIVSRCLLMILINTFTAKYKFNILQLNRLTKYQTLCWSSVTLLVSERILRRYWHKTVTPNINNVW